jgi:uncharacterized protein YndB with AHSA1/START domain
MRVVHHYDADVDTVFAKLSDPAFLKRKYADEGATAASVEADDRAGNPRIVSKRKVTVDLPGFAKKVMAPTNTVVQTDDWAAAAADGTRVCAYTVEVQGVPSRIDGTVTLSAEGGGTSQVVEAEVKVSIPLLGGRLERFAVDSATKLLAREAEFTARELAG